jgi:hypothetical protein
VRAFGWLIRLVALLAPVGVVLGASVVEMESTYHGDGSVRYRLRAIASPFLPFWGPSDFSAPFPEPAEVGEIPADWMQEELRGGSGSLGKDLTAFASR